MKNQLQIFDFNQSPVRVIDQGGQPWFVAKDVCEVLEIGNSRMAVEALDDDEKGVSNTDTLGGAQKMQIISESGLYALIFKSRKAVAKGFCKWVTSEVVPEIRRNGSYSANGGVCAGAFGKSYGGCI
jgi:prophage antirepressor-like protein